MMRSWPLSKPLVLVVSARLKLIAATPISAKVPTTRPPRILTEGRHSVTKRRRGVPPCRIFEGVVFFAISFAPSIAYSGLVDSDRQRPALYFSLLLIASLI